MNLERDAHGVHLRHVYEGSRKPAPGSHGRTRKSLPLPIDTHWTRILHFDLFTAGPADDTPQPDKELS